jgi:hypothetical protein
MTEILAKMVKLMNVFRKIEAVQAPAFHTERDYMSAAKLYQRVTEDAAFADRTIAYWDGFAVVRMEPTDATARHFTLTVLKGKDAEFEYRLRDAVGGSYVLRTETVVSEAVALAGVA